LDWEEDKWLNISLDVSRSLVNNLIEGDAVVLEQSGSKPNWKFCVFKHVGGSERHFHFAYVVCESVSCHPIYITDAMLLPQMLVYFAQRHLLWAIWTWTIDRYLYIVIVIMDRRSSMKTRMMGLMAISRRRVTTLLRIPYSSNGRDTAGKHESSWSIYNRRWKIAIFVRRHGELSGIWWIRNVCQGRSLTWIPRRRWSGGRQGWPQRFAMARFMRSKYFQGIMNVESGLGNHWLWLLIVTIGR